MKKLVVALLCLAALTACTSSALGGGTSGTTVPAVNDTTTPKAHNRSCEPQVNTKGQYSCKGQHAPARHHHASDALALTLWFGEVKAHFKALGRADSGIAKAANSGDVIQLTLACAKLQDATRMLQLDPQPPTGRFATHWRAALRHSVNSANACINGNYGRGSAELNKSTREFNAASRQVHGLLTH